MNQGGRIIGIEGIDAVGKCTQSQLLETWFKDKGLETVVLSFPNCETPIGKEIQAFLSGQRDFPELRHILFAANRWEKVSEIEEQLKANKTLIVNRYFQSNIVHGLADGLDVNWLITLEEGIPKADFVLVLDAPPIRLASRRPGRKDAYERSSGLQTRARKIYRNLASRFGWVVIDAGEDINTVHEKITEVVKTQIDQGWRERSRR